MSFQFSAGEVQGASLTKRGGFRGVRQSGFSGLGATSVNTTGDTIDVVANGHHYWLSPPPGVSFPPDGFYTWDPQTQELWVVGAGGIAADSGLAPVPLPGPTVTPAPAQSARPTFDYVRTGDVVRVTMSVALLSGGPSTADLLRLIQPQLSAANLTYVDGSAPGWFSTTLTVDVQPRNDFSHLADVASTVASIVSSTGIGLSDTATAAFVSQVEQTGGVVKVKAPPSGTNNPQGGLSNSTLLLAGGGLLLVILLAKR